MLAKIIARLMGKVMKGRGFALALLILMAWNSSVRVDHPEIQEGLK